MSATEAVAPDAVDTATTSSEGRAGSDTGGREPVWVLAGAGILVAGFVLLRFWTRSDLWLDEAQTLTIARMPITRIPAALREDGSPPLYYFLLHLWTRVFGTGDLAVRSLSGVCGVAILPLAWRLGRVLGGRTAAWAALLLATTSPFLVRYSTENRMYMLIVLLCLLGFFAIRVALDRPGPWALAGVALVSGLLLLTHYWCLYLVAAVGLGLFYRWYQSEPGPARRAAGLTLVALLAGFVLFAPWVPSFLYQAKHTGTPWAQRGDFTDLGLVLGDFGGLGARPGEILGYVYAGLLLLGLFGAAAGPLGIHLDLRVRPAARPLGWTLGATLVLAIGLSELGDSAYSARYTAVVFVPLLGVLALGVASIAHAGVRAGVLAVIVLLGVLGSYPDVTTNRTQAGEAAADIRRLGRPGDVVAYCPDQLGPAVDRLLPAGRFQQVAYPRRQDPDMVDWVDYAQVNKASRPAPFAAALAAQAGPDHNLWLVWNGSYPTLQAQCNKLLADLVADRSHAKVLFIANPTYFYENEELVLFPRPAAVHR